MDVTASTLNLILVFQNQTSFLSSKGLMELLSLLIIFLIFFISAYVFVLLLHSPEPQPQRGFKSYPLVGSLPGFLRNRHRFLDWSTQILAKCPTNTSIFCRPGNVHGIITANPLNVEHMLKANFVNYPKGKRFIALLEDFLGKGIFNSDGELWKTQRKTASYEFSTRSLRNFVMENATTETHTRLIPLLRSAALSGKVLDLQDILERFAFDNICKLAFNVDPGSLAGDGTSGVEFMQAFEEAATLSSGRFMYALPFLYLIKKHFNVGSEKKLRKSIRVVHEFADNIIRSRLEERSSEKLDQDLLSRFIGNSEISPEFLRDIVISFILAGRDTTSSALTWFFWLLSSRPDVEEKILRELRKIREEIGRKNKSEKIIYSLDELREMHYLQAAISESMRLYPPVPVDTKACLQDDVLPDGTFIGKDWFITYHTYAMGRMENIWGKDCLEYNPERWIDEKNGAWKQPSPFMFPVFHGGSRMCLGKDMAYIQMKYIAASVMERFRFQVLIEDGKHPQQLLSLTLRMKGGLPVRVMERSPPV